MLLGNSGAKEESDRDFFPAEPRGGKIRMRNQELIFFRRKGCEEKDCEKAERS
jgi:hypothetical protein